MVWWWLPEATLRDGMWAHICIVQQVKNCGQWGLPTLGVEWGAGDGTLHLWAPWPDATGSPSRCRSQICEMYKLYLYLAETSGQEPRSPKPIPDNQHFQQIQWDGQLPVSQTNYYKLGHKPHRHCIQKEVEMEAITKLPLGVYLKGISTPFKKKNYYTKDKLQPVLILIPTL